MSSRPMASDRRKEDAIRLDLHDVDRWSPALDVGILAGTAGAVIRGGGAY